MSDYKSIFGLLSGIVSLSAYIFLVIAWKRGWKPQRATWGIWIFVTGAIAASKLAGGATWQTVIIPAGYCVGNIILTSLAFKRGEGKWDRLNTWCVVVAAVGMALWWFTRNPMTALWLNIIADASAASPTIRGLMKDPRSEDPIGWGVFLLGAILGLPAIAEWSFVEAGYTVFLVVTITLVLSLMLRRFRKEAVEM